LRFARSEAEPPRAREAQFVRQNDERPSPQQPRSPRRELEDRHPTAAERPDAGPALRFYLETNSDIVDAPSIGSKTAKRLRAAGVRTVSDLVSCDPEAVAPRLGKRWITAAIIRDWQAQASLVCRVPGLRGHDAQILVGCGITEPDQLARQTPHELHSAAERFAESSEGQRILWSRKAPDLDEVRKWIESATRARMLRAA
jgi:predicted flap endonuclease-1-like 5' DNA nuclease